MVVSNKCCSSRHWHTLATLKRAWAQVCLFTSARILIGRREAGYNNMRLLSNRASTQAKIQHFDTTQQQITTRRAQIHREILEVSSEAEQYGRELEQQRRGFEEITAEIQAFQDLISVNEQNIAEFQRQLDEKQEKLRIGQTANQSESSRQE